MVEYIARQNQIAKIFDLPIISMSDVKNVRDELLIQISVDLSPENLTNDGEAPDDVVEKRRIMLEGARDALLTL